MSDDLPAEADGVFEWLLNLGLTSKQEDDIADRLTDVLRDAQGWAACDHPDLQVQANPQTLDRPFADVVDLNSEGVQDAFHSRCTECGAPLSATLKVVYIRGDD